MLEDHFLSDVLLQQPELAPCRDDREPLVTARICAEETKFSPPTQLLAMFTVRLKFFVISTKLVFSNFVFCRFVIKVSRHRCITNKFNEVYNYLS